MSIMCALFGHLYMRLPETGYQLCRRCGLHIDPMDPVEAA